MNSSQSTSNETGTQALVTEIQKQLRTRVSAETPIALNTNIARDLGLDSLAVMDFIFDLEDSFDVSIPMERIAEVQTVSDLAKAIQTLMKEAS